MFTLALRNLFRQKARTAMTLLAIMLGVCTLILSGGFVEDIYVQLRDKTIHSRLGFLQVYRTGFNDAGTRDPYRFLIQDPAQIIAEAQELPGVLEVLKRVRFHGLIDNGKTERAIVAEGVEPEAELRLSDSLDILAGGRLSAETEYGIEVGEGLAKVLALKVGDPVNLTTTTTDGGMNSMEFEVTGIFRTFSKEFDARAVRLPLSSAQRLINSQDVQALVFSLADNSFTEPVRAGLMAQLPAEEFEIFSWFELDAFYRKVVDLYEKQFGFLQLIMLGIVMLSVANSVSMTVQERIGEFGTLRALGMTSRGVYGLVLLENALLAVVGAAAGVALGVVLAGVISGVGIPMPPPPNSNSGYTALIRVTPENLVSAAIIGMLATLGSALIAGYGPTRRHIADALRENI